MAAWIEDRRVKIRRATRHDLAAIATLLDRAIPVRFGRRAVADRRDEVYVADEVGVGVVGVVGLAYRRSLSVPGMVVDVDPLAGSRRTVVAGLLDFVVGRARARGCVRVCAVEAARAEADGLLDDAPWTAAPVRVRALDGSR
jgi:N-acetylglutamate synthase-like GNAT family acetyltransferase